MRRLAIFKKEEKARNIISSMEDKTNIDEFIGKFKELHPEDYETLDKRYVVQLFERSEKPIITPVIYLTNLHKVTTGKINDESNSDIIENNKITEEGIE